MSLGRTILGLLERQPSHGYDIKRAYDQRFGHDRALHYGQVYATLSRLLKNGLIEVDSVEPGEGPERKRYTITAAGITDVEQWFSSPEPPEPYLQSTLYTKVVLALLTGRPAADILDTQRGEHLRLMRELTRRKLDGDLADQLVCDHALFHLEADLRWLELTAARLDELASEIHR
jgi:DNA-binding PadR family transcriptional regulator